MKAIESLKQDHRRLHTLFAAHEHARNKPDTDGSEKGRIGEQIFKALDVHTQLEEEIFYPAARDALVGDNVRMVNEAIEEHQVVKRLVAQLRATSPSGDEWDAKMKVLQDTVEHHVDEEETQLFPQTGAMIPAEVDAAMSRRKRELTTGGSLGGRFVKLVTRAYDSLTGNNGQTAKPARKPRPKTTRTTKGRKSGTMKKVQTRKVGAKKGPRRATAATARRAKAVAARSRATGRVRNAAKNRSRGKGRARTEMATGAQRRPTKARPR